MLFAGFDYLLYRFQLGRYRQSAVEAAGFRLASFKNFPSSDDWPRPADIIIVHGRRSALSWLVMYVTNSLASHVALMVDNLDISDATTIGVTRSPFATLLDRQSSLMFGAPPAITEGQRLKVVEASNDLLGIPYDWYAAFIIGVRNAIGVKTEKFNFRLYSDVALAALATARLGLRRMPLRYRSIPVVGYILAVAGNRIIGPHLPVLPRSKLRIAARQAARGYIPNSGAIDSILASRSRKAPAVALAVAQWQLQRDEASDQARDEGRSRQLARLVHFAMDSEDQAMAAVGTFMNAALSATTGVAQDEQQKALQALGSMTGNANPDISALGFFGLGLSLQAADPQAAEKAYRQVMRLSQKRLAPKAGVNLSYVLLNAGRIDEAKQVLAWVMQAQEPDAAARAGYLLKQLGEAIRSDEPK